MSAIKHLDEDSKEGEILSEDAREEFDGEGITSAVNVDFEEIYAKESAGGNPDWYHGVNKLPLDIKANEITVSTNDRYLESISPIDFIANSLKHTTETAFNDYTKESAFDLETKTFKEYPENNIPRHGHTEGGKGLTFYSKQVTYQNIGMSLFVFSVSFGCPGKCAFCKESNLARQFSVSPLFEQTGIIKIQIPETDKFIEIPSKIKVKFYDPKNEIVVIGPIEIPLGMGYPISKDSLLKIHAGELFRTLAD